MFTKVRVRLLIAVLPVFTPLLTSADEIDEIVVTADFRGRAASDVPASLTVIDAQQIEEQAVQHFEELISTVPNLNWSGDGHRARYFQIRGVGELEQYQGAPNPSVGFLIDDIDFSGIGTVATLFDMQRVEVLRGPQGTRYGANALAGLIYMQSTMPQPEWSGTAQVMRADDDAWSVGLAFGGALDTAERVLLRMSLQQHQSDGFRTNPYLGRRDSNGRDESTMRTRLRWLAADDWTIDLAMMYADVDDGYDAFALDNSYTVLSDRPGKDAQRSRGASVNARYTGWNTVSVTSITAVAKSDIDFSYDADWGNADSWSPVTYDYVSSNERGRRTWSQEFRFTAARWLAGLYVMRLRDDLDTFDWGDYYDPNYDYADGLNNSMKSAYEATNLAAFGQYEIDLGETTGLSVGLRAERRSTQYDDSNDLHEDPVETMFGGELSLSHDVSATTTSYLTLSRGYKAGGFNLGVVPDDRRDYVAEGMWNLEAGIKSSWREDRLLVDASVFYAERDEQQVRTSFQIDPGDPTSFVFFTDNAASGNTVGLEAELRWLPGLAWEWYASIGLLDATFDRFVTPQVDLSGREQAHAPDYSVAIGGRYTHPSGLFVRVDVSARDNFYFDVSHDERSEAYQLVNARIGYATDNWLLQLWARNLFDENYAVRGFFFGNEPPDFPPTLYTRLGDPRQIGVGIEMNF
jgi:outer membrane receptor protein involved in Fe transport